LSNGRLWELVTCHPACMTFWYITSTRRHESKYTEYSYLSPTLYRWQAQYHSSVWSDERHDERVTSGIKRLKTKSYTKSYSLAELLRGSAWCCSLGAIFFAHVSFILSQLTSPAFVNKQSRNFSTRYGFCRKDPAMQRPCYASFLQVPPNKNEGRKKNKFRPISRLTATQRRHQ